MSVFGCCSDLKRIDLPEGLEGIGEGAFEHCGLEEITIPGTLMCVCWGVFCKCKSLKTVFVEDGCSADLSLTEVLRSAKVGPPPDTFVGGVKVWDLRKQKEIVFPEGAERIGNHWFYGADVESIMVPASVKEIGVGAFCKCE